MHRLTMTHRESRQVWLSLTRPADASPDAYTVGHCHPEIAPLLTQAEAAGAVDDTGQARQRHEAGFWRALAQALARLHPLRWQLIDDTAG